MRTRGFTLIELLVVLAVIAVLFAIFAPAMQESRQSANNTRCRNNLKMIGLAMHNYHDVFVSFPPGWVAKEGHAGDGPRFGWGSMLLPYLDNAPLYNRLDFQKPLPAATSDEMTPVLEAFRCPVDSTPDANPLRGGYGTSNYSGNYGDEPFPRWAQLGQSDFWPGSAEAPMKSTGFFARNSSVKLASVTDGTSNTILVAERCVTSGAGIWAGVTDNSHEDDSLTDTSHRSRPNASQSSYSSRHEKIVHILLGDGSARPVDEKIDSKPGPERGTWQRLGHKSDGEPVGEF